MKFKLILFIIIVNSTIALGQNIPVYNFQELEPLLHKSDDKVYVINFWATWCRPCVKEIPVFNQLNDKYKNSNVDFIMISLDFGKDVQGRINTFIKKYNLTPRVLILDDPDGNSWINKVSETWSGALPATLIYSKNKRMFYEQSFELEELELELNRFLNQ